MMGYGGTSIAGSVVLLAFVAAGRPAALAANPEGNPATIRVVAHDYEFEAPATVAAGVTRIEFVNMGREFHHAWLVRLEDGKTRSDFEAAMAKPGPLPSWVVPVGGPNAPAPGGPVANATIVLRAGHYLWTCAVPGPDGTPHFMKGMTRELTVTPGPSAELPKADAALMLSDYAFDISGEIRAGHTTLRIMNYAAQPHEVEILRMMPGTTPDEILAWIEKPEGEPKAMPIGGLAPIGKLSADVDLDLEPGDYLLVCFVPDVKDGQPHFMHGMKKVITVK
jgi:hypothetical protein